MVESGASERFRGRADGHTRTEAFAADVGPALAVAQAVKQWPQESKGRRHRDLDVRPGTHELAR